MRTELNIQLPEKPLFIIERLNRAGYRADVVGGPVRDFLLGKLPDDYDITTDASPEEVERVFSDKRLIETGIKHGTVTLVLDGESFEITTYRIDGEYKDSRHPESVSFTKRIEEDLARRDFTMNAIAYNPRDGITDPFGGIEDIKKGIIRAVGEPERRFTEDALRILRGARFAARLGFSVDGDTEAAMEKKKELLNNVSAERIYTEWKKLLAADYAYGALSEFRGVISVFLPELGEMKLPEKGAFLKADYMTRLVSLFLLSGATAEDFGSAMRRLRTDSHTVELGSAAMEHAGVGSRAHHADIGRLLYEVGEEAARLTLSAEKLVGINEASPALIDEYLATGSPYRATGLLVNGSDLAKAGAKGKEIGDLLRELLFAVIDGEIANEREELLRYAGERISR